MTRAFYVLDDKQKIHHVVNDDGLKYRVNQTLDVSNHDIHREIVNLRDQEWVNFHIGRRSFTIHGTTYSIQSNLQFKMILPNAYEGEKVDSKKDREVEEFAVSKEEW